MKIKTLTSASLLSLAVLAGCGQQEAQQTTAAPQAEKVDADRIKAHVEFLADDTMKGRDTGSEGYQVAANYVVSNFKQLGLKPQGDQGTFEQIVTFRKTYLEEDSAKMTISKCRW